MEQLDQHISHSAGLLRAFMENPAPVDCKELDARVAQDIAELDKQGAGGGRHRFRRSGRFPKSAAGVLVACIAVLAGLAVVSAVNFPFADVFVRFNADHSVTNAVDLDYLRREGLEYGPTWLPDGYTMEDAQSIDELHTYSRIYFANHDRDLAGYLDHIPGRTRLGNDVESGYPATVGDSDAWVNVYEDMQSVQWHLDGDFFLLVLPGEVDGADMLRVAESVIALQ